MRILIVGDQYSDSLAVNLVVSLRDLGHDVHGVQLFRRPLARLRGLVPRFRRELQAMPQVARRVHRHVVEAAEQLAPDLVLSVDYRLVAPMVRDIRAVSSGPVAFWFPDSPGNLGREMHVLCDYDALFLKDTQIVDRYRRVFGLNAFYLPEACNPRWHRPVGDVWTGGCPSVLVAGNVYATRFVLLRELVRQGIQVVIYGGPWPRWLPKEPGLARGYTGKMLWREDKARAFRGACVVLNTLASHEADGLNTRLFEGAACGAVVLTEWRDQLPHFFRTPEEVSFYRDRHGLVSEIRRLAQLSPEEREKIGDAAFARAHRDHTYGRRFESILAALGRG